ncbi:MAG: vWA domain-containing protein [Cyanobacteria bacterium P01_C01_bin.89]
MRDANRPFYQYGLFQKPFIGFVVCLIAALLFYLFQWGNPNNVAVVLSLDLSSSTYDSQLNEPGSISEAAIDAVKSYIDKNSQLPSPNQVQVMGFGGLVVPLSEGFSTSAEELKGAIAQAVDPSSSTSVAQQVSPSETDINRAIREGSEALKGFEEGCKELMVVTDGNAALDKELLTQIMASGIKLNFITVGEEFTDFKNAVQDAGGAYTFGLVNELSNLISNEFFQKINSNLNWVVIWLGLAWVFLMWALILPIDRMLQRLFDMRFDMAGKTSVGYALFWTAATPGIVWKILQFLNLPFFKAC